MCLHAIFCKTDMDSEYPFGIFKLFLQEHKLKITMKYGWVQYPYLHM
jgi:hypothetical protein